VLHLFHKCRILTTSFASVANITLPSCLCCASNDIIRTLKTPQRLVLQKRNHLTRSTSLLPLKKPLKSQFLEGSAPLCSVRENRFFVPSSRGELQCFVSLLTEHWPFLGEFWFVGGNQGRIPSISEVGWI
jgi:hypothetical protein